MTTSNPFSLIISFPSGTASGVQIIEKDGWSGKGVVFPKGSLKEVEEYLNEPGVYVLWERGEERPRAYIGEAEKPSTRLPQHVNDDEKEFWTWSVVFNGGLNKAHIQYLEASLVELAKEANRCDRGKANTPQKPQLSLHDELRAKNFLAEMLLCLPMVGIDFLEKTSVSESTTDGILSPDARRELTLRGAHGANARGYNGPEFIVSAGSKVAKTATTSTVAR